MNWSGQAWHKDSDADSSKRHINFLHYLWLKPVIICGNWRKTTVWTPWVNDLGKKLAGKEGSSLPHEICKIALSKSSCYALIYPACVSGFLTISIRTIRTHSLMTQLFLWCMSSGSTNSVPSVPYLHSLAALGTLGFGTESSLSHPVPYEQDIGNPVSDSKLNSMVFWTALVEL